MSTLRLDWDALRGMSHFDDASAIIDFAESHRDAGTGRLTPSAPVEGRLLERLFSSAPTKQHLLAELTGDEVYYWSSATLAVVSAGTYSTFMPKLSGPARSPRGRTYVPWSAEQWKALVNDRGLKSCKPQKVTPALFPNLALSPSAVFDPSRSVGMDNPGAVYPAIVSCLKSHVSVVVRGATLFITWPKTQKNLEAVQDWQMLDTPTWPALLHLVRHELEDPRFNYLTEGEAIYKAPGQTHMTLSPKEAAVYCIDAVNPSPAEWKDTLSAYEWSLDHYKKLSREKEQEARQDAIVELETALRLWQQVKGLPKKRTKDTTSERELNKSIDRQKEGLRQMRAKPRRRAAPTQAAPSSSKRTRRSK
ncbi:hypothetical protein PSEUBRA_002512 [Kalmanozyma brasiliensis GHG001]|uniref:uncharacterized protein n=1 Tax=Kalmanozyma brasiliensis (strain GHG001) TaxID=1365824 RepID=UPI002867CFCD|nr:uncharacterized protein PSEUBRA_002512 [Kalmanozyma brasiliensis GHG001]KAF6767094.1 hypothetical protein PSEUBRA_002512 [Kalmanozyma brasiliensis GHG001]